MLDRLSEIFNQDPKKADDYRDFERRYREQPDQISDEEAARRYRELMANVKDEDEDDDLIRQYEQSFGRMPPDERRALAERYREASRDENRRYDGYPANESLEEASSPKELGRMTRRAAQKDPDLIEQIFGKDSPVSSRTGKMALAGLAAFAASRILSRRK